MKIGPMIEKLLNIAPRNKTDFALFMNMSPSGLSKILTGNRLPLQKEKRTFYQQAAAYFSKALWAPNCYAKLTDIFPVIYDFSSRQELEQFLTQALKYTLDMEYAAENNVNLGFRDREDYFLGPRTSLNMMCILLSDHLTRDDRDALELYLNLPLFYNASPDLLDRVIFTSLSRNHGLSFHYFFDSSFMSSEQSVLAYPFLYTVAKMQEYGDLFFWSADLNSTQPFLLLKGHFLLQFSTLIDGSQSMTMITHKSFIATFLTTLMKQGAKRLSFSGAETSAKLQKTPDFVDQLILKGIQAAYIFIPIGILLKDADFDTPDEPGSPRHEMIKLFRHILESNTPIYTTQDTTEYFYRSGKLVVPLTGIIKTPHQQRLPYLSRLRAYLGNRPPDSIIILNPNMPKLAILQTSECSILYLTDGQFKNERFHILRTDAVQRGLNIELSSGRFNHLPLGEEMWNTILQELHASR